MHILVLEPFGGGSHATFYRGWQRHSAHNFTILELPAVHWKWRARHSSLTLALQANELVEHGAVFDAIFCSDMLNLPEWRGFANASLNALPAVMYFHENQFTYPVAEGSQRDYHFAYNNVLSVIAAQQTWFNSAFHRDEFGNAARCWLRRMPDHRHLALFEDALARSLVCPPGIDPPPQFAARPRVEQTQMQTQTSPPSIGWVSRWEHDKRPDRFADAIEKLIERQVDFQLILLGQQFAVRPAGLQRLLEVAESHVRHCGFATSREEYWSWLSQIDVVVSTADHEFFGIGILEAVLAGAWPLLPNRLSYPEVLGLTAHPNRSKFFYDDQAMLVEQLDFAIRSRSKTSELIAQVETYCWTNLASHYDQWIRSQGPMP